MVTSAQLPIFLFSFLFLWISPNKAFFFFPCPRLQKVSFESGSFSVRPDIWRLSGLARSSPRFFLQGNRLSRPSTVIRLRKLGSTSSPSPWSETPPSWRWAGSAWRRSRSTTGWQCTGSTRCSRRRKTASLLRWEVFREHPLELKLSPWETELLELRQNGCRWLSTRCRTASGPSPSWTPSSSSRWGRMSKNNISQLFSNLIPFYKKWSNTKGYLATTCGRHCY